MKAELVRLMFKKNCLSHKVLAGRSPEGRRHLRAAVGKEVDEIEGRIFPHLRVLGTQFASIIFLFWGIEVRSPKS
jgi:hypothetical protein